jgi:hypothetical protein
MKISEIIRTNKVSIDDGGSAGNTHSHSWPSGSWKMFSHRDTIGIKPRIADILTDADLVLAFKYNGALKIIKDRSGELAWGDQATTPDAIKNFSYIISKMIFNENDLKMFQEGLSKEIENSIRNTIKKFHSKGGD